MYAISPSIDILRTHHNTFTFFRSPTLFFKPNTLLLLAQIPLNLILMMFPSGPTLGWPRSALTRDSSYSWALLKRVTQHRGQPIRWNAMAGLTNVLKALPLILLLLSDDLSSSFTKKTEAVRWEIHHLFKSKPTGWHFSHIRSTFWSTWIPFPLNFWGTYTINYPLYICLFSWNLLLVC